MSQCSSTATSTCPVTSRGYKSRSTLLKINLVYASQDLKSLTMLICLFMRQTYAIPWFYIHGSDVTIVGSKDPEWGAFHGFGQQWWDVGNRVRLICLVEQKKKYNDRHPVDSAPTIGHVQRNERPPSRSEGHQAYCMGLESPRNKYSR